MKFSFEFLPQQGLTWPDISVRVNEQLYKNLTIDSSAVVDLDFSCTLGDNVLEIVYHKTEKETLLDDGQIVKDQSLQINRMWVDDILMEPWFITEGCYYPQYFEGILKQFPNWPKQLPSQLIWHFPGSYKINFTTPFWPWYGSQRKKFSQIQHTEKDNERWENWSGSSNTHQDIVQEIYRLLNV